MWLGLRRVGVLTKYYTGLKYTQNGIIAGIRNVIEVFLIKRQSQWRKKRMVVEKIRYTRRTDIYKKQKS